MALSPEELAQRVRSPVFRSGVYFRDGATVHPGLLVRALRRKAIDAGVTLHERTPALRVRDGEITTPGGMLRAPEIVLATNAALTGWRPAARSLTNFGSYVVLTEPVPELLEQINWTGGEAIVDGRMFIHYFRTLDDGRVLMGSGSGPIGFGGRIDERFSRDGATAARAEAGLRRLLPGLDGARVERSWGGPIDVSADHLPFFAHEARHAAPLRRRLLGARRRPELARRADPRVARARRRRRVDAAAARDAAGAVAAAGAVPPSRRRSRALRRSWRARRRRSRGGAAAGRACGAALPRLLRMELGTR